MVIRRWGLALAAACIAAIHFLTVAAPVALFDAIATGLRWLASPLLGDYRAPRLDLDGGTTHLDQGEPIEPALLNSLRHEAGMRPLRC